jgi:hypothetical protein
LYSLLWARKNFSFYELPWREGYESGTMDKSQKIHIILHQETWRNEDLGSEILV